MGYQFCGSHGSVWVVIRCAGSPTGGMIFAGPDVPQLSSISSSSVRSLVKAAASIRCLRSSRANSGRDESRVPPRVYPALDGSES